MSDTAVHPKLISVKEAASQLGLSPSHLYRLIWRKKIPAYKFGSAVRLSVSDTLAAMRVPAEVPHRPDEPLARGDDRRMPRTQVTR